MKILNILTILLILLSCPFVKAQEERVFTLDEVITVAQQRSNIALIAKHTFRQSFWEYRTFKANYLPLLSVDATLPNFNRAINEVTQPDGTIEYKEQKYTTFSGQLSLQQNIGLTGGVISLNSGLRRTDNIFDTITQTSYLSTPVNISYNQPIFQYNDYKWAKRIEPLKYEKAKRVYLEDMEDVALTSIRNFFNLLVAQVQTDIAEENVAYYDTLFFIGKGRYNMGKTSEDEVLNLELKLLNAQSDLEQAKLNYNSQLQRFLSFLRLPHNLEVKLIPPAESNPFQVNIEEAIELAHTNTSSGMEFERRLLEADKSLNYAKMQGRFDANIYAVFGLTQSAQDLADAYKKPLDQQQVNVGISVPILDWGRSKGRIKMAESGRELEYIRVEQEQVDFEQNIYLQTANFNMQNQLLTIAAKADTVARKSYEITRKRYMIGKINDVLKLTEAQQSFDRSKISYYNALETYWQYYYTVRKLTLFDFRNNSTIEFDEKNLLN